jgi:hypothetical protein
MKLEIRNNYDSELAEAQGRVSKSLPVMGVLIEDTSGYKRVADVAIGKNVKEVLRHFKVKDFVDLR